jgi:hypothetical protein
MSKAADPVTRAVTGPEESPIMHRTSVMYFLVLLVLVTSCAASTAQLVDAGASGDAAADAAIDATSDATEDEDTGAPAACDIGTGNMCPDVPHCCPIYGGRILGRSGDLECAYPVNDETEVIGCSSIACRGSNALVACYEIPEGDNATVTYCLGASWNLEVLRDGAVLRHWDDVAERRAALPPCE